MHRDTDRPLPECPCFEAAEDCAACIVEFEMLPNDAPSRRVRQCIKELFLGIHAVWARHHSSSKLAEAQFVSPEFIAIHQAIAASRPGYARILRMEDETRLMLLFCDKHWFAVEGRELPVRILKRRGGEARAARFARPQPMKRFTTNVGIRSFPSIGGSIFTGLRRSPSIPRLARAAP